MLLGIGYVKLVSKNYEETIALFTQEAILHIKQESDSSILLEFPNGNLLEITRFIDDINSISEIGFLVNDVDAALENLDISFVKNMPQDDNMEFKNFFQIIGLDRMRFGLILTDQQYLDRTESNQILFYGPHSAYGYLGNWYLAPIYLQGVIWPTSEHYYQAQKFINPEDAELCRRLSTPREAFEMTRRDDVEIRSDWDQIKVDVMREAVKAKFTQNPDLKELLLATGDAELIENSPVDYFWGIGKDGTGENVLGEILMEVRENLK